MTAIGVLCARVRVEEKRIIAAIDDAGLLAVPVPPASTPLLPGPASRESAMLGQFLDATTGETIAHDVNVLVDRATNRAVAAATLPLMRLHGVRTIDAGIAATGTRLDVASALAASGVPRPASLVGFSEASSVAAVSSLGYPATLLGLVPGSSTTHLHDADTADAVIEHRVVLGEESEAIVLLQAGAPSGPARSKVHVVNGRAIAVSGADTSMAGLALAEHAARALRASLVAIELAMTSEGLLVWDVHPVSDFREARSIGDMSVAEAIANAASACLVGATTGVARQALVHSPDSGEEVRHGFAVSA